MRSDMSAPAVALMVLMSVVFVLVAESAQEGEGPLNIGSRLELFVDGYLVETMTGLTQKLHHPQPREITLQFDRPWECEFSYDPVVFKDGDIYRMYYRAYWKDDTAFAGYAESTDGIHFQRVNLGLFTFDGSKDNNLVWSGREAPNFAPFIDTRPGCPPQERYKAVGGGRAMYGLVSADGIHWRRVQDEPLISEGPFDSLNQVFWDEVQGQYVAYMRGFINGVRTVRRATSDDFIHWSKPQYCDFGDTPLEHIYKNNMRPYFRAPHIYLAFAKRFVPERHLVTEFQYPGVSDCVFMSSRDGIHWDRRFMEAFIRPGLNRGNWRCRNIQVGLSLIPISSEEMSLFWIENYYGPGCRLRRGSLRTDGFVSIHADYSGGELLTKPLTFEGRELVLNYSTSAVGSVQVELQNAAGEPVAGFTLDECPEIFGDEIEHVVAWKGGSDVSALAGQPIRLRFVMRDADLYSLRFQK